MIGVEGATSWSLIHIYMDGFGGSVRALTCSTLFRTNSSLIGKALLWTARLRTGDVLSVSFLSTAMQT